MTEKLMVSGGGIGGLAAALSLSRSGVDVDIFEQAKELSEVGAGLQLGPNAVRVLDSWGLLEGLRAVAAFPESLKVRDAYSGNTLGSLALGKQAQIRYGQPYATVHRADLHGLLLTAVEGSGRVCLQLASRVASYVETTEAVQVNCEGGAVFEGAALIGCDGLWSRVRSQMLGESKVRVSGHLAYRGMVLTRDLPVFLRAPVVTAWLGPKVHVVHYPVRSGEWFNVVAVVHGMIGDGHGAAVGGDPQCWTHEAHARDLRRTLGSACHDLLAMVEAVPSWSLWPLNDREPIAGANEHAQGRVALLGDAAHPLRPYLAQGAAMAMEDAWTLGRLVQASERTDWPTLLQYFARNRWARNARVQARSVRNGTIFHANGALRWARNVSMVLLGERLLDNPWLYEGPPDPVAQSHQSALNRMGSLG